MKVYIAAPYAARAQAADYANELRRIGYHVTSRWLAEAHSIDSTTVGAATGLPDDQVEQHALDDLEDVREADLLVLLTESVARTGGIFPSTSGGRHIETGYFMALRGAEHTVIVGAPENVFHRLGAVTVVGDWHEAVVELARRLVLNHRPVGVNASEWSA